MDQAAAQPRKCPGLDCPNDASSLQCPKCKEQGIESFFCSQDCFKRSWVGNHGLSKTVSQMSSGILMWCYRLNTKSFIKVQILSAPFSLPKLFLRSIQKAGPTILFPPTLSRDPYGRYIPYRRLGPSRHLYNGLIMPKMATLGQSRSCWDAITSPYLTQKVLKVCGRCVDWPERF